MRVLSASALALAGALFLTAPLITHAQTASTPPSVDLIDQKLIETVREWASTPVVRMSIAARNAKQADFEQDRVDALDKQWRAERKTDDQPLITAVLSNPLSTYLLRIQAGSLGLYTEVFVMDANGLNVGQSSITSDYWQGDEAKFQKTFPVGPNAVFIDEPEYDEDTATWRAQLNMTVADEGGKAVGAVTVDINLTELSRRAAAAAAS
jgi:hypothetical protein